MRRTVLLLASTALAVLLVSLGALIGGQEQAQATFSGQNGRIVFMGFHEWTKSMSLYSVNPDVVGEDPVPVTNNDGAPETVQDGGPDISPDGTRVAFSRSYPYRENQDCVPYVVNMDGTGLKDISDGDPDTCEGSPRWTTDGKIAIESGGQTYVMNADGSGRGPIVPETRISDPALSPDGRKRVVGCEHEREFTICIENADGSGRRSIANDTSPLSFSDEDVWDVWGDSQPIWSPDGSRIAFTRTLYARENGVEWDRLVTMRADGTDLQYINTGFIYSVRAAWQPLGSGTGAPETTIVSSPSPVTNASAGFDFVASKPDTTFECSRDGAPFQSCWAPTAYRNLGEGSHTFRVRAIDASGNADLTPAQRSWTVDTTAPAPTGPTRELLTGSVVDDSGVPTKLSWGATDVGGAGVARYELQQSMNGSPFENVALPSQTTTSITPTLEAGKSYQYRVRAQDKAGNLSAWKTSPAFVVDLRQEDHQAVTYAGTWALRSSPTASGGYVKYASAAGARARFSFAGKNVAWVASTGSNRGKAEVWVDGAKAATVDLYAATAQPRKVLFTKSWGASGNHVLEVRVLGTKRAASTGKQVDVDAFVALR